MRACLIVLVALAGASCGSSRTAESNGGKSTSTASLVIRLTGSDTMVNLDQAWAENYRTVRPDVSVQVAGGGSGVGIAGLIDGILDIAASSRKLEPAEKARAAQSGGEPPTEFIVGLDALAVYVHDSNPLKEISIDDLAEIYGDGGRLTQWSQLGAFNARCPSDQIIRISRQNNSGTYVYFRETILGSKREFKLGSVDQSGSKDLAALVALTPCAIGYSGMAYAAPGVRALGIAKKKGEKATIPTMETAADGSYPIARPLFFYVKGQASAHVTEFVDWALGPAGQKILQDVGFVPVPKAEQ